MRKETHDYKFKLIIIAFLTILLFGINLLVSYFGKQLIDRIGALENNSYIVYALLILLMYIILCILSYISGFILAKITFKIKTKMQNKMFCNFQYSDYLSIKSKSSGEVYFKIFKDVSVIVDFYLQIILNLPLNFLICLVTSTIMFYYSPWLALILIIISILHAISMFIFRSPLKKYAKKRLYAEQNLVQEVNDCFANNELSRIYGLENYFSSKVEEKFKNFESSSLKQTSFTLITSNINLLLSQLINLFILFLGIFFVSRQNLSLGTLFIFFSLTTYFSKSIVSLVGIYPNYLMSKLSFSRYNETMGLIDKKRNLGDKEFSFADEIKFSSINFNYGERRVLNDFSCSIQCAKINVIIGSNGSGKSTIIKLLNRLIYPSEGVILVDSVSLNEISYVSLKRSVAVMPSYDAFFPGTIRDNLCLLKEIEENKINEVITLCKLSNFIENLPQGLDTNIISIKSVFSDGEKRKLSLARTLLQFKKIICLDEPISHLDKESAIEIINSIKNFQLLTNCTFIIATHEKELIDISENRIILDYEQNN